MISHRFPKAARISRSGEFEAIWKAGKRQRIGSLEARYEPGQRPQLGIAVDRRTGNAAVRNRLKRWIREHFRTHPDLFSQPWRLVLVVRRDMPRASLTRDFDRLWARCK
ncbi:MAG: ribonuclease P protein component [Deltaproteobacteria bacterium]|nr:ribonuclease P protein component [Deltaproteobacteria bacterium]